MSMTLKFKGVRVVSMGLWLVVPLLLGLAITRQSLWIDEGYTIWFVAHRSMSAFLSSLVGWTDDAEMILYLLYMWVWVKVWGTTEIALRAANIPFGMLLFGTVAWASGSLFRRPNVWILFCLSPFIWFYMNEARPYVALMAFSTVAMVAVLAYVMEPARYRVAAPWCCLAALFLACGFHILAAFLFPSLLFMMAIAARGDMTLRKSLLRDWSLSFFVFLPGFVALGTFYAWIERSRNLRTGKPGLVNLAFVFYEFMGFAGLGPPRNELRENHQLQIFTGYWPWLLVGVAAALAVVFFLFVIRPTPVARKLVGSLSIGMGIAFAVSWIAHVPFLGRHVAVFLPMFLMIPMVWTRPQEASLRLRYLSAVVGVALAIAWGISDARLVFLHKYEKESYRAASSIAMERAGLSGGEILWAADPKAAYYYGLRAVSVHPRTEPGETDIIGATWPVRNQATDARNWTMDEALLYLRSRTAPAILVLSKPDLFDDKGVWRTLIKQERPAVVADGNEFWIYEWQPPAEASRIANLHQREESQPLHSVPEPWLVSNRPK